MGDVLLVATALAIAILGDWQLTNWQVAACVISVALGAGLFVLPYVVEYQVRMREEREDRGAELRILHKHVTNVREEHEAAAERLEAMEVAIRSIDRSAPDLSGPIQALEKKIEPLAGQRLQLDEQISNVSNKVDELSTKLKDKLDTKSLKALEAEFSLLKKELAELPAKMSTPTAPEKASEPKAPAEEKAESEETISKKIDRPSRSRRVRHEPEPRLLKRAIDLKQDKSSVAVSRIIESKQKDEATKEEAKKPEPESKEKVNEETQAKVVSPEPPAIEPEPKEEVTKPVAKKEAAKPAEEEKAEPKQASVPKLEPEKIPEPVKKRSDKPIEPIPSAESKSELKESVVDEEPAVDMFAESVPAQVKKRTRTKKSDTAVIASVFIGIGNKPFVRGSGAGLSWDSGVEMEFEEIGRWRWITPADLEEAIEIQLYRNDEDADSTGKYTLEPGQQLDLSPVF